MDNGATTLGPLHGRVAIVTGAGSLGPGIGNGRAAAILLAKEGAAVALFDQNTSAAEETRTMIAEFGGNSRVFGVDVADAVSTGDGVDAVRRLFGNVDVLVNNVGIAGPPGTAVDVDATAWEAAMRVNVTSMMLMSKAVIPSMTDAGGGAIINISSVAGLGGGHPTLFYPTSKAAIIGLTRAMAIHHGPAGIRVNCVAPGLVHTPMVTSRGMTEEMRVLRQQAAPLAIEGTGWDVGQAVLFLASPGARYISGVVLPVDGGLTSALPIRTPPRSPVLMEKPND